MKSKFNDDTYLEFIPKNTNKSAKTIREFIKAGFDPNQPRADDGTWGSGEGVSDSTKLEDKPCFKEWFKGSKVIDEDGKPKVVYHGTQGDFDDFDLNRSDPLNFLTIGAYFAEDPKTASAYAERGGGKGSVLPVYLSIKNPARIDTEVLDANILSLIKESPDYKWRVERGENLSDENLLNRITGSNWFANIINQIHRQWYGKESKLFADNIIKITGIDGMNSNGDGNPVWIAFSGSQIKSKFAESFCHETNINKSAKTIREFIKLKDND